MSHFFGSLDCEDTSQVLDVEEEEQGMVARDGTGAKRRTII